MTVVNGTHLSLQQVSDDQVLVKSQSERNMLSTAIPPPKKKPNKKQTKIKDSPLHSSGGKFKGVGDTAQSAFSVQDKAIFARSWRLHA